MHVYFKSLTLENVRCFGKKQTIDFTGKDGKPSMWNLILGENGTGKTTVLLSLVLGEARSATGDWWRSNLSFYSRNKNTPKFNFEIEVQGEKQEVVIELGNGILHVNHVNYNDSTALPPLFEKPFIFGYGATRRIDTTGLTENKFSGSINLIDENKPLLNAEEWLVQSEYLALKDKNQANLFEQVKGLLLKLFDGEISNTRIETNGTSSKKISVLFKTHYGWVPLHQLSLGYKTLIAWMVDFARGLFERYPESPNPLAEPAVCLVDEIDLHMHPRFQRKLMRFLSDLFPKTQFIVTAHSPLVAQAAVDMDANIILLSRKGDEVSVENDPLVIKRWRLDQLLASDLFGVTDEKMERRRTLLRKAERNPDEEKELEILESDLKIIPPDSKSSDLDQEILEYLRQNLGAKT